MENIRSNYYGSNYPKYFETEWWKKLKVDLVWKNPKARCFCCGCKIREWIQLHHIRYDHLFAEKLYKDIYLLCYNCHRRVHKLFFFLWRYPLKHKLLLLHVRLLKSIYALLHKKFRLFLLYFSISLFTALYSLITVTLSTTFRLIYSSIPYKYKYR